MVDLYRDIEWDEFLDDIEFDYFEFTKQLQSSCREFQEKSAFKDQNIKKPEIDTTYSNYVLG